MAWRPHGRSESYAIIFSVASDMRTTSCRHHVQGRPSLIEELLMNWWILLVAGMLEVVWAIGLKYSEGFTRLWPSFWTALSMMLSLGLLGVAMKSLPVGTAYAVWVGIGAIGTAVMGIVLFSESASAIRLLSLLLIFVGIVGLKVSAA